MNWERVKNFLIALFIGINIFLVFFMLSSFKDSASVNKSVVKDSVSILNANGIAINEDIIPSSISNPGTFDVVAINVNSSYQSPKTLDVGNIESELKKALKVLGVKDYKIFKKDDSNYSVIQKTNGYYIFDSGINAVINGNNIAFNGVWYKQQTKPKSDGYSDGGMVYVTGVLIDFINNSDRNPAIHTEITGIDVGYCVPQYDSGLDHKSMPAVPCYCITASDGTAFLYDAVSGTYLKYK